eukprot:10492479-Ditylum_brightwellii.AAC.1
MSAEECFMCNVGHLQVHLNDIKRGNRGADGSFQRVMYVWPQQKTLSFHFNHCLSKIAPALGNLSQREIF